MPTVDEMQPQVVKEFSRKTGLEEDAINKMVTDEADDLFADLGMSDPARDSMSGPLTRISKKYSAGLTVPISAIRDCDTVTDCIKLTTKRANGEA